MSSGKLIVLDGTDGSGKKTQTDLLLEHLEKEGIEKEYADFPRYGNRSAVMVEDYLNGEFGKADEVNPFTASLFYAMDRYSASKDLKRSLSEGKVIIANRYVSSNMGHQGGKIKDSVERTRYFEWLDNLEYNQLGIPRPDATVILYVPAKIAQELVGKKEARGYLKGKTHDIHEEDINHLQNAEKTYLEAAKKYGFKIIECVKNGKLLSREAIHEKVWKVVAELI
ncbi:thymidylate kinase [Patescibacteria group bacterium]|nr:thymidylate kinase [Patescibacteria group bacterium]